LDMTVLPSNHPCHLADRQNPKIGVVCGCLPFQTV
jgi:hypothetical protein